MPEARSNPADDDSLQEAWDLFQAFLRRRGARVTETRRIVLRAALLRDDHFQADDLATELARGADRVSRGTVYRTLALLVQGDFLREIRDSDTHIHYERLFGRSAHEHMVCDQCGRFLEFDDPVLRERLADAAQRSDFQMRTHHITVFGRCRDCQRAGGNTKAEVATQRRREPE
jgi:Fur family ferric uptake transcriptional regulator